MMKHINESIRKSKRYKAPDILDGDVILLRDGLHMLVYNNYCEVMTITGTIIFNMNDFTDKFTSKINKDSDIMVIYRFNPALPNKKFSDRELTDHIKHAGLNGDLSIIYQR